ncbi:MAG: hypothetical protein AB7U20_24830 [Planctomycetaceae bacterium]
MKHLFCLSFAVLIMVVTSSSAQAQARSSSRIRAPLRQPTTSPYLNLLNDGPGGRGLGFNYYQRVRPQFDYLETSQRLSGAVSQLNRQQQELQRELTTGRVATGHATSFLDYHGYYPQTGR